MGKLKSRILIAEDDVRLARQYAFVLSEEGYDVSRVDSGEAAISRLTSEHFDLVLTDIEMQGRMTGVRVAGNSVVDYPRTKVIVLTGMAGLANSAVGRDGFPGSTATIFKPVDAEQLLAEVGRVLAE